MGEDQSLCHLLRKINGLVYCNILALNLFLDRFAFIIRHGDEELAVFGGIDFVDGAYIGMVQGRCGFRLSHESFPGVRFMGHSVGQKFECDMTVETLIQGFVYLTHATATEPFENAKVRNGLADHDPISV